MPTPRDLDPKFKDANAPDETVTETVTEPTADESPRETLARQASGETVNDPNEGMIVHHTQYIDSAGNAGVKTHGPMPRSEWADYSQKNGI